MTYEIDQVRVLYDRRVETTMQLRELQSAILQSAQAHEANKGLWEHLRFGVARRASVIIRVIDNLFDLFPPEADKPLEIDAVHDLTINLHAFLMNVYGNFDNWAWAYVYRHSIADEFAKAHVGLFRDDVKRRLPPPLADYVRGKIDWFRDYLQTYRDALAHRIPPYIPPAYFVPGETPQYDDKLQIINGRPSHYFAHSFEEETISKSTQQKLSKVTGPIHPQLMNDAAVVVEMGNLFLKHLDDEPRPGPSSNPAST